MHWAAEKDINSVWNHRADGNSVSKELQIPHSVEGGDHYQVSFLRGRKPFGFEDNDFFLLTPSLQRQFPGTSKLDNKEI